MFVVEIDELADNCIELSLAVVSLYSAGERTISAFMGACRF